MTYLYAFLIGGGICVIGQILMDATKLTGTESTCDTGDSRSVDAGSFTCMNLW